jgi:hypothetical protein
MAEVRDTLALAIDVFHDIPELLSMLSIPVARDPDEDRLKSLHISGLIGIVGCALIVAATKASFKTFDVLTFLLFVLIFPTMVAWLYAAILKWQSFVSNKGSALADSLSLIIASNLLGIAIFTAIIVGNMFQSQALPAREIFWAGLVAGTIVPTALVFVRSIVMAWSDPIRRKFVVGLLSVLLAAEVWLFLEAAIVFARN